MTAFHQSRFESARAVLAGCLFSFLLQSGYGSLVAAQQLGTESHFVRNVERVVWPSGLTVLVVEDTRFPSAIVEWHIGGAGVGAASSDMIGAVRLLPYVMVDQDHTIQGVSFGDELSRVGADLSVVHNSRSTSIMIRGRVVHSSLDRLLRVAADGILEPRITSEVVRRVQVGPYGMKSTSSGLSRGLDTLYAYLDNGPKQLITPNDLDVEKMAILMRDWHRSRVVPEQVTIAVTGRVRLSRTLRQLKRYFGEWYDKVTDDRGRDVSVESVMEFNDADPPNCSFLSILDEQDNQAVILLGVLTSPRGSRDYPPLEVLNFVLASSPGARLYRELRTNRGLSYRVQSSLGGQRNSPPLIVHATFEPSSVEHGARVMFDVISSFRTVLISKEELVHAQNALIARRAFALEEPHRLLRNLIFSPRLKSVEMVWERYSSGVRGVTRQDVREVARTYLSPQRIVVAAVGSDAVIDVVSREAKESSLGVELPLMDADCF